MLFLEKGDRGSIVEVGKDNIKPDSPAELEMQSLWFRRDYVSLLKEQADRLKLDLEKTVLIYGEINLPTYGEPLTTQQFIGHRSLVKTMHFSARL